MSYWMDVIPWLNYRDPRLNKRTRAWHTFRKANMKVRSTACDSLPSCTMSLNCKMRPSIARCVSSQPGKFFRGFKKPDAPHVYYYDSIPAQAVGVQRRDPPPPPRIAT